MTNNLEQDKVAEGANLRRLLAGIKYARFAREHGLNASMIGQQMRGERPISIQYAKVYAAALGVSLREVSEYWGQQVPDDRALGKAADQDEMPAFLRRVKEPPATYQHEHPNWPFSPDLLPRVHALTPDRKDEIERHMRYVVHEAEAERALGAKAKTGNAAA